MDAAHDKVIPTSAPHQWIRVGWWALWCLFWLAAWGAVAGQNVCGSIGGFFPDQCSKNSAVVAFSLFVWFHTIWKVRMGVLTNL
jgi:hypothetical protein